MSKNLIINKLNKCKTFQFNQNLVFKDGTNSKISTSTKTQQSPQIHQLNPEFTFKASDMKKILPSKTKISQFFQTFNPDQQLIYQKVVLIDPKPLQRALQYELATIYRQEHKTSQQTTAIKKLDFSDQQDTIETSTTHKTSLQKKMNEVQQSQENFYGIMKTQYLEPRNDQIYLKQRNHQYFEQKMPYDCRKYKLQRERQFNNDNSKEVFQKPQMKRCQTQVQANNYEQIPSYLSDAYYETINNASKPFNDYNFKSLQLKENQQDFFNQYYFNNESQLPKQEDQKSKILKKSQTAGIQLSKRQNSSRLTFFRKERDYQMRKSLLQEYNQSKSNNFRSFDNKENIKSSSKFIPSLALKKSQNLPAKRLQSQFSERYLLDRRHLQQNVPKKHSYLIPKSSISYMSKETQSRIYSIRKQLKQIYQVRDNDRSKLKIKRDQQVIEQNSKNNLRRVGSIYRF